MSEKTLRAIYSTVAVLVAIYVLTLLIGRDSARAADGEGRALVRALEQLGKGELVSIRIDGPGSTDSVELVRAPDGSWTANGYPADSGAVARLQNALATSRVGHLASANPQNHRRLGVAEDSTWYIEVRRRGRPEPVRLLLGAHGPVYPSAYVRLVGSDEVYLLNGGLVNSVRRAAVDWRDRVVLRVDTAAVQRLVVTRDSVSYTLERGDSARWTLGVFVVDSGKVAELLGELARLEAQAFPLDTAATLGEATRSVLALGAAGDTLALIRMAPTDRSWTWHAVAAGKGAVPQLGDQVFELPAWRTDRLAPERRSLAGGR
jgi:hypothetical protein